jgi:hypothetical protein
MTTKGNDLSISQVIGLVNEFKELLVLFLQKCKGENITLNDLRALASSEGETILTLVINILKMKNQRLKSCIANTAPEIEFSLGEASTILSRFEVPVNYNIDLIKHLDERFSYVSEKNLYKQEMLKKSNPGKIWLS